MNIWHYGTVFLLIVFASVSSAEDKAKADPSGTWRWDYEMNGESFNDSMKLVLKKDGKVEGKYYGRDRTAKIEDGKFVDGKLEASISLDFDGTDVKLTFSGPVKGDEIAGNVKADFNGENYDFPWEPKRSVKLEDVVGTWEIAVTAGDTVREPSVIIAKKEGKEEYEATLISQDGDEVKLKDLKVGDNHLVFTLLTDFNGGTLKADFKGRPYGDNVAGSVEFDLEGQTGEGSFKGKRKAEKKKKD